MVVEERSEIGLRGFLACPQKIGQVVASSGFRRDMQNRTGQKLFFHFRARTHVAYSAMWIPGHPVLSTSIITGPMCGRQDSIVRYPYPFTCGRYLHCSWLLLRTRRTQRVFDISAAIRASVCQKTLMSLLGDTFIRNPDQSLYTGQSIAGTNWASLGVEFSRLTVSKI